MSIKESAMFVGNFMTIYDNCVFFVLVQVRKVVEKNASNRRIIALQKHKSILFSVFDDCYSFTTDFLQLHASFFIIFNSNISILIKCFILNILLFILFFVLFSKLFVFFFIINAFPLAVSSVTLHQKRQIWIFNTFPVFALCSSFT